MKLNGQTGNILKAVEFAMIRHHCQIRKYTMPPEPYVVHPLRVARMVAHLGEPLISAAILHDVLEDTPTSFEELEREFGSVIAQIVRELTDPPLTAGDRETRKRMAREGLTSYAAKTVKCADIIDNWPSIAANSNRAAELFRFEVVQMLDALAGADPALLKKMIEVING